MNPRIPVQKRRDKLVIMADILQITRTGALKTQILYRANLSFTQLNQYLRLLTATNLLKKSSQKQKEVYEATPKGLEFLKTQQEVMGYLTLDMGHKLNVRVPPESLLVTARKEGC